MSFKYSRLNGAIVFSSVILMTLYGVVKLVAATKWGVGLSPDSINYILAARSIVENGNLKDLGSHYPPLYPLVLAISRVVGVEVLTVAKLVQVIIYISNIFIFGIIIFQTTERVILPTVIGCSLLVSSQLFLEIHAMAWSEPLFLTFSLLGLFLLKQFSKKKYDLFFLVCSALFFGLALITRYAGIAFILTVIVFVLFMNKIYWRKRLFHSTLFCAVSLVPFSIWIVRNILSDRLATNREFIFHPVPLDRLLQGGKEILSWFQLPVNHTYLLILLVAVIVLMILLSHKVVDRNDEENIPEICFMFISIYIGFIIFSISFLDYIIPLDRRMLSPVYLFAFLGLLILSHRFVKSKHFKFVGYTVLILLVVNSWLQMNIQRKYLLFTENGIGYASKEWIESDVLKWVKELPNDSFVYSNAPEPIELYTYATSRMIPRHTDTGTIRRNANIMRELNDMVIELLANDGYVIYFNTITWRWYLPTAQQLNQVLSLELIYQGKDGEVFKIKQQ